MESFFSLLQKNVLNRQRWTTPLQDRAPGVVIEVLCRGCLTRHHCGA
jgi:hypothetical protein